MTSVERLASVLAAISHDLDHPGTNQSFLIATSNPLVSLYQVRSLAFFSIKYYLLYCDVQYILFKRYNPLSYLVTTVPYFRRFAIFHSY